MTVAAVITALVAVEGALSGIVKAYDETPESLSEFPCFINYPSVGELMGGPPTLMKGLHTVVCELHCSRQVLPVAEGVARPYVDSFPKALWDDPTLGGTVDTVLAVRYRYGRLEFGRKVHLGVRFEVDFKLQEVTS